MLRLKTTYLLCPEILINMKLSNIGCCINSMTSGNYVIYDEKLVLMIVLWASCSYT